MPKQRHHRRTNGIRYHVMLSYEASPGVERIYLLGLDDSTVLKIKVTSHIIYLLFFYIYFNIFVTLNFFSFFSLHFWTAAMHS